LLVQRVLYHALYIAHDPFARSTFSDGQLYEAAARDVLTHPPLGSEPFFLQGAYAYLLALGLSLRGALLDALLLQLAVCALGWLLFYAAARASFQPWVAAASSCGLLASAAAGFYENKYLSAALGVTCNIAVIAAFCWWLRRRGLLTAGAIGLSSACSVLARPNLVVALPFTLAAMFVARDRTRPALPPLAAAMLACLLGLAPMALRNLQVTGAPTVFPSHGGGIPFYIGNHPGSSGLWNTAGGLLSGQVMLERDELAERLHLPRDAPDLDRRIGGVLYGRALAFMAHEPLAWLQIEAKKLYAMLGNHEFVHDYDWYGERELLGDRLPFSLPFGVLLALGTLGLAALWRDQRASCVLLLGQIVAVALANLLWFTSAQNRLPLVVPLAFAAGPGLAGVLRRIRARAPLDLAAISSIALLLQAFVPRHAAARPSSAHYYNLANVEESLGDYGAALAHYRRACERAPQQPMFWLRYAHLARRMRRGDDATRALDRLAALPDVPAAIRGGAERERALLSRLTR
jgi:hypothetical protein